MSAKMPYNFEIGDPDFRAVTRTRESNWQCKFCVPLLTQFAIASLRARASATRGKDTKQQWDILLVVVLFSRMVHPSPASFQSASHAASEFSVVVFGGVGSRGGGVGFNVGLLMLCSESYSLAALMAFHRASSGGIFLLLKMRLFRASHISQSIQGASWPATIPAGGDNPERKDHASQMLNLPFL